MKANKDTSTYKHKHKTHCLGLTGTTLLFIVVQGDPKRCVPMFCSIKKTFFNECLFCCRTW